MQAVSDYLTELRANGWLDPDQAAAVRSARSRLRAAARNPNTTSVVLRALDDLEDALGDDGRSE